MARGDNGLGNGNRVSVRLGRGAKSYEYDIKDDLMNLGKF